jgi:phosphatidylserine decarboxylase
MTEMSVNAGQLFGRGRHGQPFTARLGTPAAQLLVGEFARHPGPKTGLVLDAEAGSPVLTAAFDALNPNDSLTVVPRADAPGAKIELDEYVSAQGAWVEQRVRVVDSLGDADPADAVISATIASGGADEVREEVERLSKLLTPGGVLAIAVPAAPFLAGDAGPELDRQQAIYGIGIDLVLRNLPPVRVHRLRFSAADAGLAERLTPLVRPSSVKLTRGMHLDSNGVAAAAILGGVALLTKRRGRTFWLLPLLAAGPVAAFFRDPEREPPEDPAAVVAASDGKVLAVEHLRDERLGAAEWLRISVFLSVLDVHVNRAPVAGRVVDHFVVDGGYAAAMKPEAEHNVAAYTVLETVRGTVAVAQRTGLIARRIVHRAPVGSLLARGERFGLIRFGSRTDVYLPAGAARAEVAAGDTVRGGETAIARWS